MLQLTADQVRMVVNCILQEARDYEEQTLNVTKPSAPSEATQKLIGEQRTQISIRYFVKIYYMEQSYVFT